jgi:DNA-binding CsgD family transcriptional regulator/tetratricopeptide (TPR) repeat protein
MTGMLVGRDAECAALRGAITEATRARGAPARGAPGSVVVLVAGEAGAGKTMLVEHVLNEETVAPVVLRGRAAEWAGTAYDALARALRPTISAQHLAFGAQHPAAATRHRAGRRPPGLPVAAADPERDILAQVMPELGTPPPAPDPGALAAAVCSVLERGPAILFLDDLQWADEATLGLLPPLADVASGRGSGVAIVGCYRSDELPRGHRLRTVRAQLRKAGQLTEIELRPLGDDDVHTMLTGLLGAPPRPALAAAVASRADGLPFAVEELAFALRDSGRLAYHAGTVTLTGEGAAPVPDGVREAVLLRASRLSEPERALLEAAAVAGIEFDIDTVLRATGEAKASEAKTGEASTAGWPDGFTAAGLLTEPLEGRSRFRHPLAQEAAYADIPWSRRRRLHRALAAAISADRPVSSALVAKHLLAARDFGTARKALIATADEHCAVHAYRDAARALRTALEHWPNEADTAGRNDADTAASNDADISRLQVIDRLARCVEMCSEYADAVALLRELADSHERHGDLVALASTHRRLALAHELRGQWESALAARETAARVYAQAGRCDEAAIDRLAVAAHLRSAASYSAALATLSVARGDAQASDRKDLLLRAEGLRGNVLSRLGNAAEGIKTVRTALDEALKAELADTAAELQQRLADSIEHSGDYHAATAAYGDAYQYCDALGKEAVGQLCRACATAVLFSRGEWDRAAAVCDDVLAAADSAPHTRAVGACLLGLIHALRGTTRSSRTHLLEASVISARIELTAVELLSAWGLAVLEERAGAHTAAADRARQVLARLNRTQERHYCVPVLQWSATFFGCHGLADDARACAAALSRISGATAQPEAIATLAHALGETLLPDDPAAAARELCRAAGMFADLGLPFATAQAQHRAAIAAIGSGDRATGRQLLLAAQHAANRLGARQLLDNCAAALAQLGGSVPARANRASRAIAGLTAREFDVMRLVADGNTAKEVGAALFISPRTVEMHVQGCLLKLGCRTRAEAVRKLAELGALATPDGALPPARRRRAPPRCSPFRGYSPVPPALAHVRARDPRMFD